MTFAPDSLANNQAEEAAYRRGFDQGVAQMAYLAGLTNKALQELPWKQELKAWRYGRSSSAKTPRWSDADQGIVCAEIKCPH